MTIREQTAYDLGFHEGRNAAVVHGRWVMGFSVRCSVCNGYALTDEDHDPWITPYCPNCGSKMDGGSHEVD